MKNLLYKVHFSTKGIPVKVKLFFYFYGKCKLDYLIRKYMQNT
ncbi:hypothetical protein LEP1GSC021_1979 [Leptospira noguchii str. 1993005606]|nr:hypothetical protein LEP1GSC021_1979 [Leptospira noguchii str. 1993005606]